RILEPLEKTLESDDEFLFALSEAYTRQARELSNRIAASGDRSARAHQLLAYRYRADGDARNAEAELRKAILLRPNVPGLNLDLANLFWEQKRHEEAAIYLAAEVRVQPNDFMANLRLGQYLLMRQECHQAQRPLQIASRHRRYPESFQLLAYAHRKCGDLLQANAVVAAGLTVFPENRDLTRMRSEFGPDAKEVWAVKPLHPESPTIGMLRARLADRREDEDDLFLLSQLYSERGQALEEKLAQLAPNSYRTLQLKGLSAEYAGKWDEAETYYRQVVREKPELPGAHYALGLVLMAQGRDDEGAAQLRAELALDPKSHLSLFQLGTYLLKTGELKDAIQALESAVRLRPQLWAGRLELARALLQAKRPDDAAEHLEELLAKEPGHPSAHFLLYRAYLQSGAKDKAAGHLEKHRELLKQRNASKPAGMN
ncbi:MAG: tetratricopeptide repeat protein, partial [Bryobacteraceae bacterium]